MPEQTVIVWDLETIPDLAAAARMLDMGSAPEADVQQAMGDGFPQAQLAMGSPSAITRVSRALVWPSGSLPVDIKRYNIFISCRPLGHAETLGQLNGSRYCRRQARHFC